MEIDSSCLTNSAFYSEPAAAAAEKEEAVEEEDLEAEASPIRAEWPSDSLLTREHFTIDTQRCLTCHKDLGHAMPMNRLPKRKYLFCDNETCPNVMHLQCWVCGNYNNENSGHVVHRPGNSAYTGPSQIYSFMCFHCYKDQMEGEPGLEETREKMKEWREMRRQEDAKDTHRYESYTERPYDPFLRPDTSFPTTSPHSTFAQPMPRKRPRIEFEQEVN